MAHKYNKDSSSETVALRLRRVASNRYSYRERERKGGRGGEQLLYHSYYPLHRAGMYISKTVNGLIARIVRWSHLVQPQIHVWTKSISPSIHRMIEPPLFIKDFCFFQKQTVFIPTVLQSLSLSLFPLFFLFTCFHLTSSQFGPNCSDHISYNSLHVVFASFFYSRVLKLL